MREFPLAGEAHFSAWLAGLFTPLVRGALSKGELPCIRIGAMLRFEPAAIRA